MNGSTFSFDDFLSLNGAELVAYAEPFVTSQKDHVPIAVYEVLANKLGELSDIHTVYALELCMQIDPQEFVSHAIGFLSHPNPSVCCTASRLIEALPTESLTSDLVARIADTPVVELTTLHVRTGKPIQVGTNKNFIDRLLAKHNCSGAK